MSRLTQDAVLRATAQRLRAAAQVLEVDVPAATPAPGDDVHTLLVALIDDVREQPQLRRVWLLLAALGAQFPSAEDVRAAQRRLELQAPREAEAWLLTWARRSLPYDDAAAEIEIVTDKPLVDVDFSARNALSTGIQRVVRNLAGRWADSRDIILVRWRGGAYSRLSKEEAARVGAPFAYSPDPEATRLIPWGVPVVVPEVPFRAHSARLSALAELSPNPVSLVGHDCIPVVSAELVADAEREKFGQYLELVKYADVVAGVSNSAAGEFAGFVATLPSQGLSGPRVTTCRLATSEQVRPTPAGSAVPPVPEVLCVGSLDVRKNQIALVEAAEHLWREGLEFRLRLVGAGSALPPQLDELIKILVASGRLIDVEKGVTDASLDEAYRRARAVVFPTLHEGFGLPVAEALSYGVPVITSDFGSVREIAEGRGAILVDPADIWALAAAIRKLLTDDDLHRDLKALALARPTRTWDDYAAELWEALVP